MEQPVFGFRILACDLNIVAFRSAKGDYYLLTATERKATITNRKRPHSGRFEVDWQLLGASGFALRCSTPHSQTRGV